MLWWCSAQGTPWTWTWRPYVGVWLFVLAIVAAYVYWHRAATPGETTRARRWAAAGGVCVLWIILDWPIGALGAGYLESVHALQFLVLSYVATPLLLIGLPAGWETRLGPRFAGWLRTLAHPVQAIIAFNLIVIATHVPAIVDALMVTQVGSLAIDAGWIAAGLLSVGANLGPRFFDVRAGRANQHPAVRQAPNAAEHRLGGSGRRLGTPDPDRNRLLHRQGVEPCVGNAIPLALERDQRVGPQPAQQPNLLRLPAATRVEVDAQRLVLDFVPANADTQPQPPTAEHIDRGRLLGYQYGLPLRQDDHATDQLDPLGHGGEEAE
jgi:hypothetical protein